MLSIPHSSILPRSILCPHHFASPLFWSINSKELAWEPLGVLHQHRHDPEDAEAPERDQLGSQASFSSTQLDSNRSWGRLSTALSLLTKTEGPISKLFLFRKTKQPPFTLSKVGWGKFGWLLGMVLSPLSNWLTCSS